MSQELEVESIFDKTSVDLWEAIQNDKIKCLQNESFRKIIGCCQKLRAAPPEWLSVLSHLSSRILTIIASGELKMDSQIVASTAYFMVLDVYQTPKDISKLFCEKILKVTKKLSTCVRYKSSKT